MLCQVKIPFTSSKHLQYGVSASSVMHGILMENVSTEYAAEIHQQSQRPFSQFVRIENELNTWTISTLDKVAYENIIAPLLALKEARVKHKNDIISFSEAKISFLTYDELLEKNLLNGNKPCVIRIETLSPCAFKSAGSYVILPTPKLILTGLAKRFDMLYGITENDYDSLSVEIERSVYVSEYSLRSSSFSLEGVHIPSFSGYLELRVKGDIQLRSYISMLCEFAEFSGIGIKTALGMGQVRCTRLAKN